MKTYIVYDGTGREVGHIQATGHNKAEVKAKKQWGSMAFVEGTEISKEQEEALFGKKKQK